MGQDSAVGTVTGCGLDGPWMESYWGRDFTYPSRLALASTQLPVQWETYLFSGGKAAGRGVDHVAPRLKKVYSYTSTTLLSFHGLF